MPGEAMVRVRDLGLEVDALRIKLALAREHTRFRLTALRQEIPTLTEWRPWYRARPLPFLAAAFLVGFLLAGRRCPRR